MAVAGLGWDGMPTADRPIGSVHLTDRGYRRV